MAWPIYSERFLAVTTAGGYVYYVVPTGMRAVVKSISMSNWAGNAGRRCHVQIAGAYVLLFNHQAAISGSSVALSQVAYGGEQIRVYQDGDGQHCFVSGHLFDDPSGRSSAPQGPMGKPIDPDPPPSEPTGA